MRHQEGCYAYSTGATQFGTAHIPGKVFRSLRDFTSTQAIETDQIISNVIGALLLLRLILLSSLLFLIILEILYKCFIVKESASFWTKIKYLPYLFELRHRLE